MILFQKMIFDFRFFLIALISFLSVHVFAEQMTMLPGEVTNFELPRFDEKSGNKLWELFGKKAKDVVEAVDIWGYRCKAIKENFEAVYGPRA